MIKTTTVLKQYFSVEALIKMATLDQVCLRKPKKLKTEEEVGTRKSDPGSIDGVLRNANTATCNNLSIF